MFMPQHPSPTVAFHANTGVVSPAGTYTFSNQAIGAASPDRIVVVSTFVLGPTAITGVTIGGISATPISVSGMYYALVPSGTTATIVITSPGADSCGVGIWTIKNYLRATPYSSIEERIDSGSTTTISATLAVPQNGVVICGHRHVSAGSTTWSGAAVSENYDFNLGGNRTFSGMTYLGTNYQSVTFTTTFSSANYPKTNCASWY